MRKVAVIGAGAAGLMAAVSASQHGARVTLYERNPRIGKKLLNTGNGRCNYSNTNATSLNYNPNARQLVHSIFQRFDVEQTIAFFRELGIEPKVEQEGKLFPRSEQAGSFLDVFLMAIKTQDIELISDTFIAELAVDESGFTIKGRNYDAVIVATGGKAMPNSGSDGQAYHLAEAYGHTITKLYPAIVQLKSSENYLKALKGLKLKAKLNLYGDEKKLSSASSDLLFTDYGVSGPAVLQLSRYYVRSKAKQHYLTVNLFPDLNRAELIQLLTRRQAMAKLLPDYLVGLVHKKLIITILKLENLDKKRLSTSLSAAEIQSLAERLTAWKISINGTMSWQNAQVTAGGIDLAEVSPNLSSYCLPNLYFAGEILDVDGQCGGFNLQWAWSSGYIAGLNAAIGEL